MASYLGINMSGRNINVVNSNGGNIGVLFHKERFTYSFEMKTINGRKHKKIWFLDGNGYFGAGYILDSDPIQNWMNYRFYDSRYGYHFKVDGRAQLYSINGAPMDSIPTGSLVIPAENARSGDSMKYLLKIDKVIVKSGSSEYHRDDAAFIYTEINYDSTNTPVYGNWN